MRITTDIVILENIIKTKPGYSVIYRSLSLTINDYINKEEPQNTPVHLTRGYI